MKNRKKIQNAGLALIISLLVLSCKVQQPIIGEPERIQVDEAKLSGAKIRVWLPIENPNNFKFNVKDVSLDIYVNGTKLGKVTHMEKVCLPKKSKASYALKLDIRTKDLAVSSLSVLHDLRSRKVRLGLQGDLIVSKFVFIKKVDIEVEESLDIW